jgi:hypothetical protein
MWLHHKCVEKNHDMDIPSNSIHFNNKTRYGSCWTVLILFFQGTIFSTARSAENPKPGEDLLDGRGIDGI